MAELRYLTIQPDTKIRIDGKFLGHIQVLLYVLQTDRRFHTSNDGIKVKKRLRKLFTDRKAGDVVVLDQPDWQFLRDVFQQPTNGYFLRVSVPGSLEAQDIDGELIEPYIDALSDEATKKDPLPKEAKARDKAKKKLRDKGAVANPESNGVARSKKAPAEETA